MLRAVTLSRAVLLLRLRLLQWAGRPGPVVRGVVMGGDHFLLEWSLGDKGWPLPIHAPTLLSDNCLDGKLATKFTNRRGSNLFPTSGMFTAWRRGFDPPAESNSSGSELPSNSRMVLVRVLSSLLAKELWLMVDLSSETLGGLYALIEAPLRSRSCRRELVGEIRFEMRDSLQPKKRHPWTEDCLLRNLCWTHSETLIVEQSHESDYHAASSHIFCVFREDELVQRGLPLVDATSSQTTVVQDVDLNAREDDDVPPLSVCGTGQSASPLQAQKAVGTVGTIHRPLMWWDDEGSQRATLCALRDTPHRQLSLKRTDLVSDEEVGIERPRMRSFSVASGGTGWLARNPGDTAVDADPDLSGSWERLAPHYPPKLLKNTHQTRQFEFHPSLPQVLLTGDKKGGVNVVDTDGADTHPPLIVDSCPVLGLAWMRHHPQSAVCGAAHSGQIRYLKYDAQASQNDPALQHVLTVEEFPKLSSLSINCTDDLLLASGFTHDVALYDNHTGQVLHRVLGVHNHFINISRFAHRSPHVFATASFDHTCKVWDCRQPLLHNKPVKVLQTGGLNVMCTFSPDDKYLLSSGIDTRINQFELPSFTQFPASFPLRPAMHQARYRRSMYFATGRHFVTAATDESHIRVMSATGKNLGVVDFCGLLGRTSPSFHRPLPASEMPSNTNVLQRSRMIDSYGCKLQRAEGREEPRMMWEDSSLIHGEVQLDDEQAPVVNDARNQKEYVQSVRTHPIVENRVGVLLSSYHPDPQSYIAFVHLDPNYSNSD